jgi:hypothetical protein
VLLELDENAHRFNKAKIEAARGLDNIGEAEGVQLVNFHVKYNLCAVEQETVDGRQAARPNSTVLVESRAREEELEVTEESDDKSPKGKSYFEDL